MRLAVIPSSIRSVATRASFATFLLIAPIAITWLTSRLGTRRGVWVTLAGVLLGMLLERPLRPFHMSQRRWLATSGWRNTALGVGIGAGLFVSVVEGVARGVTPYSMAQDLWVPIYRALFFACGLTLLRRLWREQSHPRRTNSTPEERAKDLFTRHRDDGPRSSVVGASLAVRDQ